MLYRTLAVCAGLLLFVAVADLPYGYYTFLRIATCLIAALGAIKAYGQTSTLWTVLLGGIAILFNPIAPIYMEKSAWIQVDIAAGIVMISSAIIVGSDPED